MMLSRRERYIAIAAGAVLALLVLDQVLFTPLATRLSDAQMRIDLAQQELVRAGQLFDNSRRARQRWVEMAGQTLQTDAPAAESQVLNASRNWAQSAGLAVTSLKPERIEREQDFQRITIRLTATGTMAQIARFLHAVQTTDIPLRVSDLQISSRRDGQDDLSLQIGLATILLPPEPPRSATGWEGSR